MTLLPVIERELRAEARSAFTYWLRFFGAVALLAAGVLFFTNGGLGNMAGGKLFQIQRGGAGAGGAIPDERRGLAAGAGGGADIPS